MNNPSGQSEANKANYAAKHSEKEILEGLSRILSSDLFTRSFVLSNFLKFIVEETLEGRRDGLKEYTIGVSALGKPDDFNPQSDAIVRIHAGRLRRLLNEYYLGPGKDEPIVIEVIKGTYAPVFRANIPKKPDSKPTEKPTTASATISRSKLTLAVLPFRNLCAENEYQFFVDGFGEELTRIFSSFADIDIVSHHSTRRYASEPTDMRIIGNELGAHYLISGSVRRSTEKIRVSIGLTETLNGVQIWSKDYIHDLDADKIMDIQDQIDDDVFAVLGGHYGFIVKDAVSSGFDHQKLDIASFDAIAWNYYAQTAHSKEACASTRVALEKVIENDPKNYMCLVMLGDLYLYSNSLGYPTIENPIEEAHKIIKKAVGIAPLSQYANMILGWSHIHLGQKKEAIKILNYSLTLAPASSSVNGTLGFAYACVGEYKRALVMLTKSLELTPYCPWWYYLGFYFVHFNDQNYREALEVAYKIDTSDDVFLSPLLKIAAMGHLGLIAEAKTDVSQLEQNFHEILSELRIPLGNFILDKQLIENIIDGAKKAGLRLS